jgi:DNA-binding NarL/FixJ family response regulator
MTLRCVIADDSRAVRQAAHDLLERQGLVVVGVAATADEAARLVETQRPDVILIDIDLGADSGFALARRLADGHGDARTRSILMSTRDQADYAELIAASPAAGFLPKSDLSATAIQELLGSADEVTGY